MSRSIWGMVGSALVALGAGCSGGAAEQEPGPIRTGVFVDSPVANVSYTTKTLSGLTNASGEFSYRDGEEVTFSIGALRFPSATAAPVVTPMTLAGTTDTTNPMAINIARLLMSLDEDGDPTNGIQVPAGAAAAAAPADVDLPVAEFEALPAVTALLENASGGSTALVPVADAVAHLNRFAGIVGTWKGSSCVLILTAGGDFVYHERDAGLPNGTETGTYTHDPMLGSITFAVQTTTNWTYFPMDDVYDYGGISSAGPGTYTLSAVLRDTGALWFAGALSLSRQAWTDGIVGTWAPVGGGAEGILTLYPDGTFLYVEIDGNEPDGAQAGTYGYSAGTNTILFTVSYDEMEGEGITSKAPPYSYSAVLSGDSLLIDGTLGLARQ